MKSFVALLFALFVSYVSAAAVAGSRSYNLLPRVNAKCPVCDQLPSSVQECLKTQTNQTDPVGACQCSDTTIGLWRDCWNCGFSKNGLSAQGAQKGLDAIAESCASSGHPLSNPPKIDASSSSGAASGGASGSASASSPSSTNGAVQIGTRHAVAVALALSGVVSALM